jgi:hypothetical protein
MRHRTALITAGSIAAVVFAGAIAIGTNLGILTVSDSKPVGQLTAASMVQTAPAAPVQEAAGVKKSQTTQAYLIKKAGTVKVAVGTTSVRLSDVTARPHWTWKLAQSSDKKLTVTFAHGSDTYTFVAVVGGHGKLSARVDHPVTRTAPAASPSGSSWVVSAVPSATPTHVSGGGEPHYGGGADD